MNLLMEVDDESIEELVKQSLLDSIDCCDDERSRKHLEKTACYYMTWEESVDKWGKKKASKLWGR